MGNNFPSLMAIWARLGVKSVSSNGMGIALTQGGFRRWMPAKASQPTRNRGAMTRNTGKFYTFGADFSAGPFFIGWSVGFLLVLLGLLAMVASVEARIVKNPDETPENDPHFVFAMIASAWEDGDQQALADLVHESGLKVTTGGDPDRSTHYSPSQAFYYFKNMFQAHRTLLLTFDQMQDASAGDRVHAMAIWKRRRPDSERIQEVKLVYVLARQGDQWRLAEINKIR